MRQYAVLAQKITALLLREQEIELLNFGYKTQMNSVIHALIENKYIHQEFLKEFLEKESSLSKRTIEHLLLNRIHDTIRQTLQCWKMKSTSFLIIFPHLCAL